MTNEPALQALVERVNAARASGTPLAIEGGELIWDIGGGTRGRYARG